ncbi:MAG: PEP-CTERM sorting domain-containing protein [Steroidobacteraceae bacterium]|nr:PEP-CTERM sorting domain-containing protein [Steroidobacteraceae bacterium]
MNIRKTFLGIATIAGAALYSLPASAVPVLCQDWRTNHMYVDSAYVSSCVDAGTGNLSGNAATDQFLLANTGYTSIGDGTFTQVPVFRTTIGSLGQFWLDSNLWNTWSSIAIGFKFGTGNRGDNWFVFQLDQGTSTGFWGFVNAVQRGGGLSHIELYGAANRSIPEPGTLALLGVGLIGAALARRRKRA